MSKRKYIYKIKQLKRLVAQLKILIISNGLSIQIEKVIAQIRLLVQEMSLFVSSSELKKVIGSVAFLIGVSFPNKGITQSFFAPVSSPFGLSTVTQFALPLFSDIDGDGDIDILVGEYSGNLQYFENIGTTTIPSFSTPVLLPFGLISSNNFAYPAATDLDGDGDMDILIGEYNGVMKYYENTGSYPSPPQFSPPITNPFGLSSTYQMALPTFVDFDGDGDMDLIVGEYYGALQYFENIGTSTSPNFAPPIANPFGLVSTYYYAFPAFADFDLDGDLDLIVGEYYGVLQYFENIGTSTSPNFAPPIANPFNINITPASSLSVPTMADLDADGDWDLLIGDSYGSLNYFENASALRTEEFDLMDGINLYPNPVVEILNIKTNQIVSSVEILNLLGEVVVQETNKSSTISLKGVSSGFYTVKITLENGDIVIKKIEKK